jgi:hypothetical protein
VSNEDLGWLASECELRATVKETGFTIREVVPAATWLHDPMPGWVDEDGAFVFCDIGGQDEPGWDPRKGHGSIWRLHRDDHLEPIVPPGEIGKGMIMFPMRAPDTFGKYGGRPFFLGQLKPGRPGALWSHAVYWVPQGWETPEVFVTIPDAGTIGHGIPGALCTTAWDEEIGGGALFVHSLMNCTIYKVTPDRRIETWLICDKPQSDTQFMPGRLIKAGVEWGSLAGQLIVTGLPNGSFENPPELKSTDPAYFHVQDGKDGPVARRVEAPEGYDGMVHYGAVAPESFAPYGGHRFVMRMAEVARDNPDEDPLTERWAPSGPAPYNCTLVRIDDDGKEHPFVESLQAGSVSFQGDRLLILNVRKSYSTGEYHYPDGSIYAIERTS